MCKINKHRYNSFTEPSGLFVFFFLLVDQVCKATDKRTLFAYSSFHGVVPDIQIAIEFDSLLLVHSERRISSEVRPVGQNSSFRFCLESSIASGDLKSAIASPTKDVHVLVHTHFNLSIRILVESQATEGKRNVKLS